MRLRNFFRTRNRDLFGDRLPASEDAVSAARDLAFELRRLSERAVQAGLDRAGCLIEVSALIVEMEGAQNDEDQLR